jgi:hypothetical protein
MPPLPQTPYPATNLSAGSFDLDGLAVRCLRRPSAAIADLADAAWIPERRPTDVDWRWRELLASARDAFAVLRVGDDAPVALFCSTAPRLLRLAEGATYRLDSLEVGPRFRGARVGLFTLAAVASRALECGASKLVLASVPEARKLYDRAGGKQQGAKGWKAPKGLLPYEFSGESLRFLQEVLNEQRQD